MSQFNFGDEPPETSELEPIKQPTDDGPDSDAYPEAVVRALEKLLNAKGWDETCAILEREHILLLTDTAEQFLTGTIMQSQQSGDPEQHKQVDYLMLHLTLLRQARARGIPAAWVAFELARRQTGQEQTSVPKSSDGISFTPEEAERAAHDADCLAEKLSVTPDDLTIPAVQTRLRQALGVT